ncbi:N-acetyltransferase [Octadecabacter sp. G9-8]|uniref:N-acetyltransferase n=1 Tax=Octadecabacter dasysiphoniae TaxID=2909341 RepID=A0ABS9CRD6_9RHOB|nr:GNAT family N-acetyltransferase [Octadecabacter dasysiphoniae]MCF2869796.1 N-acetyltransferase [Octadecabacter dasysiphoniae]
MSDPSISEEQSGSKGRFVIATPEGEAELTFSILSPRLRIADHTSVPKALEGHGYAYKLMLHLIEDAKSQGYKIVPLCPYVNAQRAKHPEWSDYFSI